MESNTKSNGTRAIVAPSHMTNCQFLEINHLAGFDAEMPSFETLVRERSWSFKRSGSMSIRKEMEGLLLRNRSAKEVKSLMAWKDCPPKTLMDILENEAPNWFSYIKSCISYTETIKLIGSSIPLLSNGFSDPSEKKFQTLQGVSQTSTTRLLEKKVFRNPSLKERESERVWKAIQEYRDWVNDSKVFMLKGLGRLWSAVASATEAYDEARAINSGSFYFASYYSRRDFRINIVPKHGSEGIHHVTLMMNDEDNLDVYQLIGRDWQVVGRIFENGEAIFRRRIGRAFVHKGSDLAGFLVKLNDDEDGAFLEYVFQNVSQCVFCGRTLTQAKSQAQGAGDVCHSRYGGAWKEKVCIPSLQEAIQESDHEMTTIAGQIQMPSILVKASPVLRLMIEDEEDQVQVLDFVRQQFDADDINVLAEFIVRFYTFCDDGMMVEYGEKKQERDAYVWMKMLSVGVVRLTHYLQLGPVVTVLKPFLITMRNAYCWEEFAKRGFPLVPELENVKQLKRAREVPTKPKRAYDFFCQDKNVRGIARCELDVYYRTQQIYPTPAERAKQMTQHLRSMWEGRTDDRKKRYLDMAEKDKQRYVEQMRLFESKEEEAQKNAKIDT